MVEGEYDGDTRTTEGGREGNTGASHVPEVGRVLDIWPVIF